jgi:hypothetical protein
MVDHGLARLEEVRNSENHELEDAYIRVDKQKVLEDGKEIIGKYVFSLSLSLTLFSSRSEFEGCRMTLIFDV